MELRFELPGVAPDSIDVSVERNVLTVKAERSWIPNEGDEVLARERTHAYDHGVLSLTIPVAERAKPRKVEIAVGDAEPALEVGSSA